MNIRKKIEEILKDLVPGIDVSADDIINENGIESLTMIQLISEIDMAFDIEIKYEDIINGSLRSIDAIEEMVNNYMR